MRYARCIGASGCYGDHQGDSLGLIGAPYNCRRLFGQTAATGCAEMFVIEPHYVRRTMHENISGSAGVLVPVGRRAGQSSCSVHGYNIPMITGRVMCEGGFTEELFALQHFDGVTLDMFTSAEDLTGSRQPVSVDGKPLKIRKYFGRLH
eukprot:TRINITY_DN45227_c0_g1_i1.p1 TRINITY_DN45227_c0_g1~~TRINITY_DN45227_c0_g1_i1.p1  ORF type:complete len:149 (-),score=11.10 TRINITY_DN45227_c0_g1_i1:51-497(-)